mgnify:CR=1 FL=1
MKKNNRIAVLMGGLSSEREVSMKTGKAVLQALVELGVTIRAGLRERASSNERGR